MSKKRSLAADMAKLIGTVVKKEKSERKTHSRVPSKSRLAPLEMKFHDVVNLEAAPILIAAGDTTTAVTALNDVVGGDDRANRTGRKIQQTQLQLRIHIRNTGSTSVDPPQRFRIVVFVDTYGDGITAPVPDEVYVQDTALGSPNIIFYGMRNMLQPERFRVILDKYTTETNCTTAAALGAGLPYSTMNEFFISLSKHKDISLVSYTNQAVATANKNRMYLFVASNRVNTTGDETQVFFHSRIKFTDI